MIEFIIIIFLLFLAILTTQTQKKLGAYEGSMAVDSTQSQSEFQSSLHPPNS